MSEDESTAYRLAHSAAKNIRNNLKNVGKFKRPKAGPSAWSVSVWKQPESYGKVGNWARPSVSRRRRK